MKLIKSESKDTYNTTNVLQKYFVLNAVLLNFLFIKKSWKNVWFPQKWLSSTTIFNIDNNKYLFEHKISIIEWFMEDHVSNGFENFSFFIISYISKYIKMESCYFQI